MTIHGRGYRASQWRAEPMWRRLLPVAWLEFRGLFRTRPGLVLFLLCQIPTLQGLGILLILAGIWQVGGPGHTPRLADWADPESVVFYGYAIDPTRSLAALLALTTLVSSRAVAKDRAQNAFEIYWTRGITPVGYFLGKWAGSVLLIGIGSIAGPLLLWLLALGMLPEREGSDAVTASLFETTITFVPGLLLGLVVFTALLTGLAVALSAIVRTPNLASILWVLLLFGGRQVAWLLHRLSPGEAWYWALSPWDVCRSIAEAIAGLRPSAPGIGLAVPVAAAGTVGVALLLRRRLRLVEAVA